MAKAQNKNASSSQHNNPSKKGGGGKTHLPGKLNQLSTMRSFMHIHILLDPPCDLVDHGRISVKDSSIALFPKVPPGVDDEDIESSLASSLFRDER